MELTAKFITFEGGDGSGKSTQIKLFNEWLHKEYNIETIVTREPGGTPEAEKIRNLLVQRDGGDWDPLSEVLLLSAARREHLIKKIWPAIEDGKWVLSDRFVDSTYAFQGYGMGLGQDYLQKAYKAIAGDFTPDITFILDIDPEKGLERSNKQNKNSSNQAEKTEDRYEGMGLDFQKKLRDGFLDIAKRNPKRCKVIDAAGDINDVQTKIREKFTEFINKQPRMGKAS